ncbi:hypothetical protein EIP93_07385 [Pectobacterium versatile]|nr:hypothetical protein EIP93_07385 [Pectobacterium versatile]
MRQTILTIAASFLSPDNYRCVNNDITNDEAVSCALKRYITRHTSSCMCVGYVHSPESLT